VPDHRPSAHIPTAISQELKAIGGSREALIKTRPPLIGRVRGYVRAGLGRVRRATPDADSERRMLAAADQRLTRLMTVPGVSPVTAARVVTAIDAVGRFPTARVSRRLGGGSLANTTGFSTKRTRLTRAGAPQVRLGPGSGGRVARYPAAIGSDGAMGETHR
jgi:transposase